MRLVTIDGAQGHAAGLLLDDEVLDIACAQQRLDTPPTPRTVKAILAAGDSALDTLRRLEVACAPGAAIADELRAAGYLRPLSDVNLLAPIPDPGLILACSRNSRAHLAEMGVSTSSQTPHAFMKNSGCVIGPGAPIRLPKGRDQMVDWEVEFCGVIGRPCHGVSESEALDYVAGYTLIVDISARDWAVDFSALPWPEAIRTRDTNTLGKQYPTFCPMGFALATKEEIADPAKATYELSVNGVVKQRACTDDLIYSLAYLISHYSQWYKFMPGDVVTTGSPAGVGMGRRPPEFLKSGDVVTVSAAGIGTMSNPVVAA